MQGEMIQYLTLEVPVCRYTSFKCDKVFKHGASKICGRQFLKNLKGYCLLKQSLYLQTF